MLQNKNNQPAELRSSLALPMTALMTTCSPSLTRNSSHHGELHWLEYCAISACILMMIHLECRYIVEYKHRFPCS